MRNTALSAAHMVIYPEGLGGGDMVKVRLQGTKEDMEWLEEQLLQMASDTNSSFDMYYEINADEKETAEKIKEAQTDEEVYSILNDIILANNSKLQDNKN